MKYDDASWHSGGNFPQDLPAEAGATHIGFFLTWCLLSGYGGEIYVEDPLDPINKLRLRQLTPGEFLLKYSDGKFTDEDLNIEGNAFAEVYFYVDSEQYIQDYEQHLANGLPTFYHVADTWQEYEKLSPVMDERFRQWKNGKIG